MCIEIFFLDDFHHSLKIHLIQTFIANIPEDKSCLKYIYDKYTININGTYINLYEQDEFD